MPTVVEGISGEDWEGEVIEVDFRLNLTCPGSHYMPSVRTDCLHVVVLYAGIGFHAFVLEPYTDHHAPMVTKFLLGSSFELNAKGGVVFVDGTDFSRNWQRSTAANAEAGTDTDMPTLEGSLN
ncbi:hypothetical protein EVA_19156 [gut metagenome]|uniref:Uncharacterized protein n=1 Tax=gut metagenome TaxID=749906 RepID=J9FZG9_9ZZZZ